MRILLAEDDRSLSDQIKTVLTNEGRAVDCAYDGQEALFLGGSEPYDLIILDLGLPRRDGISVLKKWRSEGVNTAVLILTARDGWSERVDGLDAGADDFMPKPFHMSELSARIRAMFRRLNGERSPVLTNGDVSLDTRTNSVTRNGMPIALTSQEQAVITYLFQNIGRFVSRTEVSEHIYEYDDDRDSNTIAVFINRLRNKLGKDFIQTVRGQGYRIRMLK